VVGNHPESLRAHLQKLFELSFEDAEIEKRKALLQKNFSNTKNAKKLIELVFDSRA